MTPKSVTQNQAAPTGGLPAPSPRPQRSLPSLAWAVVVEVLILGGAGMLVAWSTPPTPEAPPIPIELAQAEPEPPKPKLPKPPEPPKPVVHKIPVPRPQPAPPTPQRPVPQPPAPITPPTPPTAFSEPPPPPKPLPPPTPAPAKSDGSAEYLGRVKAAVQAAVVYPPAALAMNFSGRVRVEFHLLDAHASQARVVQSSGIGLIDRAALRTVQDAHYPAPPPSLQGKDLDYQVWVEFRQPE